MWLSSSRHHPRCTCPARLRLSRGGGAAPPRGGAVPAAGVVGGPEAGRALPPRSHQPRHRQGLLLSRRPSSRAGFLAFGRRAPQRTSASALPQRLRLPPSTFALRGLSGGSGCPPRPSLQRLLARSARGKGERGGWGQLKRRLRPGFCVERVGECVNEFRLPLSPHPQQWRLCVPEGTSLASLREKAEQIHFSQRCV